MKSIRYSFWLIAALVVAACNTAVIDDVGLDKDATLGVSNGYEWVDLGLSSGCKWATCNVGASVPEEYGDYFAWGETEPYYISQNPLTWKSDKTVGYTWHWSSYKFRASGDSYGNVKVSKYNTSDSYGQIDNKTTLELADDAARANWGGNWSMPTNYEWYELYEECAWTWTTQNGVTGMLVTGHNGNSIFLPAAGFYKDISIDWTGQGGYYWSSSLLTVYPLSAVLMCFYQEDSYSTGHYRYHGYSVRPVLDEGDRVSVSSVSIDQNTLTLDNGESAFLKVIITPADATCHKVYWSSSNRAIVMVDDAGKITAMAVGSATITASTLDGDKTATCIVTVLPATVANGYEWVDLGLPSGLKWATCNVGATKPEGTGDFFSWGETEAKSTYDWSTYKWSNGSEKSLTKYCLDVSFGTVDNSTSLELADDAAYANWGGTGRMPTDAEWTELREKCTWTFTSQGGVEGMLVSSNTNGNRIFLPAAGYRIGSDHPNFGSSGSYWSSSLNVDAPSYAWSVYFTFGSVGREGKNFGRRVGYSVRPVTE